MRYLAPSFLGRITPWWGQAVRGARAQQGDAHSTYQVSLLFSASETTNVSHVYLRPNSEWRGSGVNHLGKGASSRWASAVMVLMMGHSLSLVLLRYACKRLGLADAFAEFLALFPARKEGLSDKGAACASGREASRLASLPPTRVVSGVGGAGSGS